MYLIEPPNFCFDPRYEGPLDAYECQRCGHYNETDIVCECCEDMPRCEVCEEWVSGCECTPQPHKADEGMG